MQAITTGSEFDDAVVGASCQVEDIWQAAQKLEVPADVRKLLKSALTATAMLAVEMYPDDDDEESRRYRYLEGWRGLTEMVMAFAGEPHCEPPCVIQAMSEADMEAWIVVGHEAQELPADGSFVAVADPPPSPDSHGQCDGAAIRPFHVVESVIVGASARGEDRSAEAMGRAGAVGAASGTDRVSPSPICPSGAQA